MALEEEDEDSPAAVVLKIAQQTTLLLEARRKKSEAKKMAKLMKNFNYDLLRGGEEVVEAERSAGKGELKLEEGEMERMRRLEDIGQELASGGLIGSSDLTGIVKYEAPLITLLRSVETVDEMYHLADKIVPLGSKRC